MKSPSIRTHQIARALEDHFEVAVLTSLSELGGFDAVVAQKLPYALARRLRRGGTRVVYDLYTPNWLEALAILEAAPTDDLLLRLARVEAYSQELALASGDAFVCTSERQRDYWLGVLAKLGRLDIDAFGRDPTFRDLIDVVHFGLPVERPVAGERVLKGVVPGIDDGDFILLWAGGILNWTDPLTVIRAVLEVARSRPAVKLVFLGVDPADPDLPVAAREAVELSSSLGVLGRTVFFHSWVPYEQRSGFLLESDVGVAAYLDLVETRLAYRARLLDYFWAGLPTVTTGGDTLGELVSERQLGRAVGFRDVAGWTDAIRELIDDEEARRRAKENLEAIRSELAWPRVVEPLVRLLRAPTLPISRPRPARLHSAVDRFERLRLSFAMRGPLGAARAQLARLGGRVAAR
ncbi:MAG: glycosyltransferase [Thermoleophilia bacterium]